MDLLPFMLILKLGTIKLSDFMIERGLKLRTRRAVSRMEGGVFFKEVRMEGGRGSGGPASHTRTFPDLVPPPGQN